MWYTAAGVLFRRPPCPTARGDPARTDTVDARALLAHPVCEITACTLTVVVTASSRKRASQKRIKTRGPGRVVAARRDTVPPRERGPTLLPVARSVRNRFSSYAHATSDDDDDDDVTTRRDFRENETAKKKEEKARERSDDARRLRPRQFSTRPVSRRR